MSATTSHAASLAAYYRWHAGIYDLTRWAFLFGRDGLIRTLRDGGPAPRRVLEIGCGTGKNLAALAEAFPHAHLTGLDLSREMLDRARSKTARFGDRVDLLHRPYEAPVACGNPFDLIVFSYSLSMIHPGCEAVLDVCRADLAPGGLVAVVDFHETRWTWFRRWMGVNHVHMEGELPGLLRHRFEPLHCRVRRGYGDLWRYLVFIGAAK